MRQLSETAPLAPDTPIDALGLPIRVRKLLVRSDIQRLGELVLLTETGVAGLRGARRADWAVIQEVQRGSGLERSQIPIVYLPVAGSLTTHLIHFGIRRVGDLLGLSEQELRALPALSVNEANALCVALARFGLALGAVSR